MLITEGIQVAFITAAGGIAVALVRRVLGQGGLDQTLMADVRRLTDALEEARASHATALEAERECCDREREQLEARHQARVDELREQASRAHETAYRQSAMVQDLSEALRDVTERLRQSSEREVHLEIRVRSLFEELQRGNGGAH